MTVESRTLPFPAAAPDAAEISVLRERLRSGGGWLTLALMLILMASMAGAVNAAAWSEGLIAVQAAAIGGVLLGFALALTRWDGAFPAIYSLVVGLTWTVVLMNNTFLEKLSAHEAVQIWVQRNADWLMALFGGRPNADNLIFVTQLSLLAWWIGYLGIWSLVRYQRVLYAIVPAGLALLVNAYYSAHNLTGFLLTFLAAAVLLAIRIELARNEIHWRVARIRYTTDIALDFLWAGMVFAVVVIGFAWILPNVSDAEVMERLRRPLERPWKQVEDTWARMYKSLRYQGPVAEVTSFGKSMGFGGPVQLTDRPIFRVEANERTYWRASVFDLYTSSGWDNTDNATLTLDRSRDLGEPAFSATRQITTTIRVLESRQDVIFGAPQPVRVSLPIDAEVRVLSAPNEPRQVVASIIRSRIPVNRNDSYWVASNLSDAAIEMLRADNTNYPNWVRSRYLQLPDTLPRRVRELARQLVAQSDNPYDKAAAIEAYLRTLTYNQNIAAPPANADGVDYFLFSVKQGYCDYYASAMAVMLRAVGIPSRFVTGYTPGQLIETADESRFQVDAYQIVERNAHAWVEAYFPTYGWIMFEPTASETPLARPRPQATPESRLPPIDEDPINEDELDALRPERGPVGPIEREGGLAAIVRWVSERWPYLAGGLVVLLGLGGGWWGMRRQRSALLADPHLLGRLFDLLGRWAARLRVTWPASHTPLEHAAAFNQVAPQTAPTVNRLADLFVAEQYGRQTPAPAALSGITAEWYDAQPALWRQWGRRLYERLRSRPQAPLDAAAARWKRVAETP